MDPCASVDRPFVCGAFWLVGVVYLWWVHLLHFDLCSGDCIRQYGGAPLVKLWNECCAGGFE